MFTDIEGSTRLLQELGEQTYQRALAEHRRVVRAAFRGQGGYEVDYEGDAFFYAFRSAERAVAAVSEAMGGLAEGPIRVRVGLHTGDPGVDPPKYVGLDVHLAARIMSAGHGGQVLLSASSAALVEKPMTELGEHRLKDFDEPVALFQLGKERFPPLKTISNTNLPRPASSFVGRQRERVELLSMLLDGTRLLTLSGPGGSGKTRLAIETAAELVPEFKAGVFWVGLSALREPALVGDEITKTLGAGDELDKHIGEREMLLLLDNFEQVVEAAPALSQLLESCPHLKLLVTSRALLRVRGEVEYPVPPLAEPEAVELFCTRAQVEPDETVGTLCRRLDDLPLALELAAARTRALSPAQILERVSHRLDLLEGGRDADPRQQTLRATIAWSHELLDDHERDLFARLAVFRGGCTLEAAEEVAAANLDTLQSLVEQNLVRHTDERFWQLETIREYARERLARSQEAGQLRTRHALFYLAFAESAAPALEDGSEQASGLARIGIERDNLRAALEWARDSGEGEILLRLVGALRLYWIMRGYYQDLETWLPLALQCGSSPAKARLQVLWGAWAQAFFFHGRSGAAYIPEWLSLAEQEGYEHYLLLAMNATALEAKRNGEIDEARKRWIAIVERAGAVGDTMMSAVALVNQGSLAYEADDFATNLEYGLAAVEIYRDHPNDINLAETLGLCGWSCLHLSDAERAASYLREAVAVYTRLGGIAYTACVWTLGGLGATYVAREDAERGMQLFGAITQLSEDTESNLFSEREQQIVDQAVEAARIVLGEEAFAISLARGKEMTPDEISALALAQ